MLRVLRARRAAPQHKGIAAIVTNLFAYMCVVVFCVCTVVFPSNIALAITPCIADFGDPHNWADHIIPDAKAAQGAFIQAPSGVAITIRVSVGPQTLHNGRQEMHRHQHVQQGQYNLCALVIEGRVAVDIALGSTLLVIGSGSSNNFRGSSVNGSQIVSTATATTKSDNGDEDGININPSNDEFDDSTAHGHNDDNLLAMCKMGAVKLIRFTGCDETHMAVAAEQNKQAAGNARATANHHSSAKTGSKNDELTSYNNHDSEGEREPRGNLTAAIVTPIICMVILILGMVYEHVYRRSPGQIQIHGQHTEQQQELTVAHATTGEAHLDVPLDMTTFVNPLFGLEPPGQSEDTDSSGHHRVYHVSSSSSSSSSSCSGTARKKTQVKSNSRSGSSSSWVNVNHASHLATTEGTNGHYFGDNDPCHKTHNRDHSSGSIVNISPGSYSNSSSRNDSNLRGAHVTAFGTAAADYHGYEFWSPIPLESGTLPLPLEKSRKHSDSWGSTESFRSGISYSSDKTTTSSSSCLSNRSTTTATTSNASDDSTWIDAMDAVVVIEAACEANDEKNQEEEEEEIEGFKFASDSSSDFSMGTTENTAPSSRSISSISSISSSSGSIGDIDCFSFADGRAAMPGQNASGESNSSSGLPSCGSSSTSYSLSSSNRLSSISSSSSSSSVDGSCNCIGGGGSSSSNTSSRSSGVNEHVCTRRLFLVTKMTHADGVAVSPPYVYGCEGKTNILHRGNSSSSSSNSSSRSGSKVQSNRTSFSSLGSSWDECKSI